MPKVNKIYVQIDGVTREFDVLYSSSRGFYFNKEKILNIIGEFGYLVNTFRGNGGDRFEREIDLREALRVAVGEYHKAKRTQRKIIAYRLYVSTSLLMNEEKRAGCSKAYCGYQSWVPKNLRELESRSSFSFQGEIIGRGFSIEWDVFYEVNKNGLKYYHVHDDGSMGLEANIDKKMLIVPWTEARENGFRKIDKELTRLVQGIGVIIGDTGKMIEFLDTNKTLSIGYDSK